VLVNETIIMIVKSYDSLYVTCVLRMMLLPINNALYTRTVYEHVLGLSILLCDLMFNVMFC
jgi:hypothetical protein